MYISLSLHIYIYIYIYTHLRSRARQGGPAPCASATRTSPLSRRHRKRGFNEIHEHIGIGFTSNIFGCNLFEQWARYVRGALAGRLLRRQADAALLPEQAHADELGDPSAARGWGLRVFFWHLLLHIFMYLCTFGVVLAFAALALVFQASIGST